MPILEERWVGAAGHPTTFTDRNGTRTARTRSCAALSTATLLSTAPEMFTGSDEEAFQRLRRAAKLTLYGGDCFRSEEHTSELQSLMRISYAVFCLKKKKTKSIANIRNHNIKRINS